MGRRSLDATNARFIWCARAAVTFLRVREWVLAVFLWVEVEDVCVLLVDVFLRVERWLDDEEDPLSCPSRRPDGSAKRQARTRTDMRIGELTASSLARLRPEHILRFR